MKTLSLILPLLALASTSQAAIIASGLRDIVITHTTEGVYLDVDGGVEVAAENTAWDINPFFGGQAIASVASFQPVTATITLDSPALNLSIGETVSAASIFSGVYSGGFSGSENHIGIGPRQFTSGSEGYIGFRLTSDESAGPFYGWMRLVLSNNGSSGLIRDWAYENTGSAITVGAVPEPTVLGLFALSLVGLLRRQRS